MNRSVTPLCLETSLIKSHTFQFIIQVFNNLSKVNNKYTFCIYNLNNLLFNHLSHKNDKYLCQIFYYIRVKSKHMV